MIKQKQENDQEHKKKSWLPRVRLVDIFVASFFHAFPAIVWDMGHSKKGN